MEYHVKYNKWLKSSKVSDDLKKQLQQMNEDEIKDAFYCDLEFGTGGLRGIMGPGTNRMNEIVVKKTTYGFVKYLLSNYSDIYHRGVVIAHDNRLNSDSFTLAAARVIASFNIPVYIFDSLRPTPMLSFAVRYLKAVGGIVITASHNAKEYNGYKIYNHEGCQLILEQSDQVLAEIEKIHDELSITDKCDEKLIYAIKPNLDEAYYDMVLNTSLRKVNCSSLKVVYTPQHGTGYVPVKTVLNRLGYSLIEVKEQCFPSTEFINTKTPNPEDPRAYELAIEYAKESNADLVIATDPDCDRLGIVILKNNKPVYLSGNQTGALLIDYILKSKTEMGILPENSIIYNTIVTSQIGNKVAQSYNVKCEQTLTGFKYIGNKIENSLLNNGPIFQMGYEESYGYLLNTQVRDKDAVMSVMMVCEMATYYKSLNKSLLDVLEEIQKQHGYYVDSQYSYVAKGMRGIEIIKDIMEKYRQENYSYIADDKVTVLEDYLSLKRYENRKVSDLCYEKSDVLRYLFSDGSFVAIRPSGTEPKCKFYFSVCGKTYNEAKRRHDKIKDFILKEIENAI